MSFYTSLSGLKSAQTDLGVISNNVANANSYGFKKSRALFSDVLSASPTQSSKTRIGQGTRLNVVLQQFTQGALESTDKATDLAIAGEGFFVTKSLSGRQEVTFTRNGAFEINNNGQVVDQRGSVLQLLPVDANGEVTGTTLADAIPFEVPANAPGNPAIPLVNVTINAEGLVTAAFADWSFELVGSVALASFTAQSGLRPIGDSHFQSSGDSGEALVNVATTGSLGAIRSGALERANVDVTEELVALISAQRNFQANAKAIETASNMTQTIVSIR